MRLLCLVIMLGTAAKLNGTAALILPHLTGSETVTSYFGTATPTVAAGKITFKAGNIWDLTLSDGSRFPFSERAGIKAHDVSGSGNHGYFENPPSDLWQTPDNDFLWELDYGANPALLGNGNPLQVTGHNQSLSAITIAARVSVSKPAADVFTNVLAVSGESVTGDHGLAGIDLRGSYQWIVTTFDGLTAKTYINDTLGNTAATVGTSQTLSADWWLGFGHPDSPLLATRYLLWSRVLSAGELTALNTSETVPASGLLLDYLATHSKTDPIKDRSGSGNPGAGMGSVPIVNVPAQAAKNGLDAMGEPVFNPSGYTRVPITHSGDQVRYTEPVELKANAGERAVYVLRTRNFESGFQPAPESVRVVTIQH